ncbi:MAG: dephospho-CoA kinase [Candidatus Omnitrophica bacterium]|nr:dephospho-CoA kinase [Candidatus Omnitrophota bacterium]MCF7891977.1 dephospho-CoA kinase [Candidatus Omnitrophota bacterium]MCF7895994.1 dephospho-CoA kinase [Candidatus Omnitrophota bacterium]
MAKIGLTGRIGSGKTTVMKMLVKMGAKAFDADRQVHQFYRDSSHPVYKKVKKIIPEAEQGSEISREKLKKIVFKKNHKLRQLERVVHPAVIKALKEWLSAKKKEDVCVAELPLLFELKLENLFDKTVLLKVKEKILAKRLEKKYGFSDSEIKQRLSLYLPVEEKEKKSSFVLNNNSGLKNLEKEVSVLWQKINKI